MPAPSPEALRLAESWRLAIGDRPIRGVAGERLGRGTGSSLEFQDRRGYALGDDVRHLDWGAFARTDQLLVRQYREEILPRVDLIVDGSRSMALGEAKERWSVDVAALFALAALQGGLDVRLVLAGERPRTVEVAALRQEGLAFEARASGLDTLRSASPLLRAGAIRVLVSDFLFPHDARELVRWTAGQGGEVALVQVLATDERRPEANRAARLTDVETEAALDLVLDRASVDRYERRLARLVRALEEECRRAGARFASLTAEGTLERACRAELLPAGILAPP